LQIYDILLILPNVSNVFFADCGDFLVFVLPIYVSLMLVLAVLWMMMVED
jgi:hypothetical protein